MLLKVYASGGSGNSVSRGRATTNRSNSVMSSPRKASAKPKEMKWDKPFNFTEMYRSGNYIISKNPNGSWHLEIATPNPSFSYNHTNNHLGNFDSLERAKRWASDHKNKK